MRPSLPNWTRPNHWQPNHGQPNHWQRTVWLRSTSICAALLFVASSMAWSAEEELAFYREKVQPILREHCLRCHSHQSNKARGGLVLDSRHGMLTGGDSGPALVAGDSESSLLITAIRYDSDDVQMPPAGKIPEAQIQVLVEWVTKGAVAPESALNLAEQAQTKSASNHWAFQPVAGSEESDGAIDGFVEVARHEVGVKAVDRADRQTLLRRLFLDLTGLPPTLEESAEWSAPDVSVAQLVDMLLERPEFGERWGRHWLDVARYADSNGCSVESNNTYDNAWRYRDYVISALNDDKPYDRFVMEQIAGDLLEAASDEQRSEFLIATGFLLLGPKAFGTSGYEQFELDVIDEQIDTVGKAMLGMSFGCARCHDHKFDPISTRDYYALAGIFASTNSVRRAKGWRQGRSWHRVELPVIDAKEAEALKEQYAKTKQQAENGELKKRAEERLAAARELNAKLRETSQDAAQLAQAERDLVKAEREMKNASNMAKVLPVISPVPVAMAVSDADKPRDEAVRVRGEPDNRREVVPRRVLPLLADSDESRFTVPEGQSGRKQLAAWLVDTEHGTGHLLARVAVNRIWAHLLAHPLVASVDNFGLTGEQPTHPELLDYLAGRFIESGWSTKTLVREIVLSETYQLAAVNHEENLARDPSNTWLWRYEPKRVDAEVLRDALLAVSGKLDSTRGGKTLQHQGLVTLGGDHLVLDTPSPYLRRSVYVPIYRDAIGLTPEVDASMGMLGTFDFADPNLMAGSRQRTVVPAQALFMLNAQFIQDCAEATANRLQRECASDTHRVERLYELAYGRPPRADEQLRAMDYLNNFDDDDSLERLSAWTSLCQAVFGSNEFLFQD